MKPENTYYVKTISVSDMSQINWDTIEYAHMSPRPECNMPYPNCAGQLVLVKDFGLVARLTSDDLHPWALCEENDGPVCNDSALEFFLQLDDTGYINFETNYNCVNYQKFGPGRHDRLPIADIFEKRFDMVTTSSNNGWAALIFMPFKELQLVYPQLDMAQVCSGFNFCGDFFSMAIHPDTACEYYLQWVDTGTPKPDYHVPEGFGYFVID